MNPTLLVDLPAVFGFQQHLKQRDYPVQGNINYAALLNSLTRRFAPEANGSTSARQQDAAWRASRAGFAMMFAFAAINPEHEGQQKFCAFLRGQGFTVDETDFRDAFVIPNREHPYQRLSTRITYIAGMLAAPYDRQGNPRTPPHLVVVSDAFDVYYPLLDYVRHRRGQVTIAFFRRGMEERWQRSGVFDSESPIKFCDLSDDAKGIVGVDLASSLGNQDASGGLADFRL